MKAKAVLGVLSAPPAVLGLVTFHPIAASVLGVASILSKGKICGKDREDILPLIVVKMLHKLRPFRRASIVLATSRMTLPVLFPATWRTICYWRNILPLLLQYLRTQRAVRRIDDKDRIAAMWASQHEMGAKEVTRLLARFKGFMLKLSQILATKSDYLPEAYPRHLSKVFNDMPQSSFSQVAAVIKKELGAAVDDVFFFFERAPIASATVAQVHKAFLSSDGRSDAVAVKVQHKNARKQICGDIHNLQRTVALLSLLRVDLGFDMVSLTNEYAEVVPHEFEFAKELENMLYLRECKLMGIVTLGLTHEYLDTIVLPEPIEDLCSPNVLTMNFIEGCPFISRGRPAVNSKLACNLLTALLHEYGRQIFVDHAFHTDPHPGNLLVTPDNKLALLDFGQVKYLSPDTVTDMALLVMTLASRNDLAVAEKMEEVGLGLEGVDMDIRAVMGYIFFDTRMDRPEFRQKPGSKDAEWMNSVKVKAFPQAFFMLFRVVTILRGIFATVKCEVSAAMVWEPYARYALGLLDSVQFGVEVNVMAASALEDGHTVASDFSRDIWRQEILRKSLGGADAEQNPHRRDRADRTSLVSIGSCIHNSGSYDSLKERYEEYIRIKRDSHSRAGFTGFTGLDGNPVVENSEPEISLDQFNSQSHVDDLFDLAEKQMRSLLGEDSTPAALENRSSHTPEFGLVAGATPMGGSEEVGSSSGPADSANPSTHASLKQRENALWDIPKIFQSPAKSISPHLAYKYYASKGRGGEEDLWRKALE
mmetsp:Transcript_22163/g.36965  ORF Transcript_22163/g.36965 Transcript_22163/m.36965 type:complete len:763 (+) Transcript_22163:276-2564(+)|eukprot:CAMPEP_0198213754 /NCGR_PEP_ID=MMETSP1445-20131203/32157_1 /TAXON_ID=36898 /ORGANISM="Pyramimonas sp., Strain CCMP2087" /LENGTH=762 /DNA_ID=CAMNT_0043888503 /DNA_START=256 /DNA_END=2544 /DNA_ORIENTATION=-